MLQPGPTLELAPDDRLTSLEGVVERVTFHSPESGYSVLRLLTRESAEPLTIVGNFSNPVPGETLLLFGRWIRHPKFGLQFQADRYQVKLSATTPLASSLLR